MLSLFRQSRPFLVCIGLMIAVLFHASPGAAQSVQGAILGTVKDSKGAVISGATVTLTNELEGAVRTTTTNAGGDYQFQDTVAGTYTLTVSARGFEKWVINGTPLNARQQLRLDAKMDIGNVQQTVEVSGDNAGAIETETPAISTTFHQDDLQYLPTNYRGSSTQGNSAVAMIGAMPGVEMDQNSFSLQGATPNATEYQVDGINIMNIAYGGGQSEALQGTPNGDSIAEVKVLGMLNPAEYGDPAQVSFTSRSGTNQLHGATWWYLEDMSLNANPFGSVSRPHLVDNTYGASLGGPVVIPHLYNGHNKTFFYGTFEGFQNPKSEPETATIPTAAMWNGDFTNYSAQGFTGLNPAYSSNGTTLNSSVLNSVAPQFKQFFPPAPNHVATAGGQSVPVTSFVNGETPNYYYNANRDMTQEHVDVRGDQYMGSNQKALLWGRYTRVNWPSLEEEAATDAFPLSTIHDTQNMVVVSFNYTFKPNLINEFRYGFSQLIYGPENSLSGETFTNKLGLQGLQDLSAVNGMPELSFSNFSSFDPGTLNNAYVQNTHVFSDALTWSRGHHDFKFGVEIRRYKYEGPNGSPQYGDFSFSLNGQGSGLFTGVDFGDFLAGIPNQTSYGIVTRDVNALGRQYFAYAQDSWKATERLTVQYGVRWEFEPAWWDASGNIANLDPSVPLSGKLIYPDGAASLLTPSWLASVNACDTDGVSNSNSAVINGAPCMPVVTNSQAGLPLGLVKTKQRFFPRLGFAYRLTNDNKTVVRGGFGIYGIQTTEDTLNSLEGDGPMGGNTTYTNFVTSSGTPNYQFPQIYAGSGNSGSSTNYGKNELDEGLTTDWKNPYTEQWALSVDHDFGAGYALRASYIGSASRHLEWQNDLNVLPLSSTESAYNQPFTARPFPNWGRILYYETSGVQYFNSLQLQASHRMQHGLSFDSTFTWAKNLSDNQGTNPSSFAEERGNSATYGPDIMLDYGNVVGTRRLHWNTTGIYDLPVGHGKQFGANMPRILDAVIGGWKASAIFTWQTGAFMTPSLSDGGIDPSGTGSGLTSSLAGWVPNERTQRPDMVPGVNWKPSGQNKNNWINGKAYACPGDPSWTPGIACRTGAGFNTNGAPLYTGPGAEHPLPIGRFGNSTVGSIVGPGYVNLNGGLFKVFTISERVKLRAEGTFTNVLNHTNLNEDSLNTTLTSASYGTITSGIAARQGQIGMHLDF
jgi:hypothetical protein